MADDTMRTRRDPDEVRQDIEHTLTQMDDTVDALAERLSPEHLIDQAWDRLRGGTDEGFGRVMREHPIPVALVGVGLGWLAVEEATGRGDDTPEWETDLTDTERRRPIHERYAVQVEEGREYELQYEEGSDVRDRLRQTSTAKRDRIEANEEKAPGAGERAREMASEAGERARELGDRAAEKLSEATSQLRDRARRTRYRARRGFWETLEENPLVLGAVAFGVGLASGVAVPSTEAEDRIMGRTSDKLGEEAKRVGRETAEKAKHVAKDAAKAAAREADHVVDAAAEAAERSAKSEGLTAEDLKGEARSARDRTVQQAKEDAERLRRGRSGGSTSGSSTD